MSPPDAPFTAAPFTGIILAGQRSGRVDPLAEEAGVANKSLVPIAGAPLIRHVVDALIATPGLARLRIVVEPGSAPLIAAALPAGITVEFLPAAANLADSVYAAARGIGEPMIVTTSDNVLLTPAANLAMLAALAGGADVALAVATEASVMAAHPEGQRRFYRLADDAYSNCNLYALGGARAAAAAETFRSGGQFAKKPLRMLAAIGPLTLVLLLRRRLPLRVAIARISRRFRLRVEPVVLTDGSHAIDVDNARTHRVAELLLLARRAGPARAAA